MSSTKTFSTKYSSAIVFGKVSIVEDEDEKKKGLEALIKKIISRVHRIWNEIYR